MTDTNEGTTLALYHHCCAAYRAMHERAHLVSDPDADDSPGQPEEWLVYEGMVTRLFARELNLSTPYYTSVMAALKRMGCIRQIRRGGGTAPSQWELITEPTEELFENKVPKKLIKSKEDVNADAIAALNRRVNALEEALQNFIRQEAS
jgi:hypothetical protein